jgi:hypothetical protein
MTPLTIVADIRLLAVVNATIAADQDALVDATISAIAETVPGAIHIGVIDLSIGANAYRADRNEQHEAHYANAYENALNEIVHLPSPLFGLRPRS